MSKTAKIIWGIIVIIVLILLGIWASKNNTNSTNGTGTTTATGEPIKIGFVGPLTGDAAAIGQGIKSAIEIATDEVNKSGGVNNQPLNIIYEDGQCNAKAGSAAATKLMGVDGVKIIIGGSCSTETASFGKTVMDNKVLLFSPVSSAPSLSQLGQYFFRDYPSDNFAGNVAARYAYNQLHAKKVAIVYNNNDLGKGLEGAFTESFKTLGGQILTSEGLPQEARDFRTILSKVKSLNPDLIYFAVFPEGSTVALKQAKDLGLNVPMLGADTWDDPKLQSAVAGFGQQLFYVSPKPTENQEFKSKMLAKTGSDKITVGSANAYDAVKILANVLVKTGLDTDKIQAELRNVKYDGVSGHIEFDQHGDLKSSAYSVKKIENGVATEVMTLQ